MESTIKNGDCLKLMNEMQDNSIDFTLTDIPYGEVNQKSNGLRIIDKDKADILTFNIQDFLKQVYRITKNSVCIFCGREQFSEIYKFFSDKGVGTVRPIIWQKSNPSPMNGEYIYLSGVELAVWYKKKGAKVFNARCKNTVFKFPNGSSKLHPTQKNEQLFSEIILDNTNENDVVFDPCFGSGTTIISCIKTNRKYIGYEIDKNYFETAKKRIDEIKNIEDQPTIFDCLND